MASPSRTVNGSSDYQPDERPAEKILLDNEKELEEILSDYANFETQLREHQEAINTLAEEYSAPRDVGIIEQELAENENVILTDFRRLKKIDKLHPIFNTTLTDTQTSLIMFWSNLGVLETNQRKEEIKHRRELEDRLFQIEKSRANKDKTPGEKEVIEVGHQALIESLEIRLAQCQINIQSIEEMKLKYQEVKEQVERVRDMQIAMFRRLLTVMPMVGRNLTAINKQRMINNQ